ncbi:MAG: hypothetical protein ABI383_08625, partial [Acidobacteriaceae bacterium]
MLIQLAFLWNSAKPPDTSVPAAALCPLKNSMTDKHKINIAHTFSEIKLVSSTACFSFSMPPPQIFHTRYRQLFLLPSAGIVVYSSINFKPFIQEALLGYVRFFAYALLYFYISQSFKKEQALRLLQQEKSQKELENVILKQQQSQAQQEKLQFEHAFLRS